MIEVHSEPTIEQDQGKWTLVFWMGHPFDYAIPFRAALKEMADRLGHEIRSSVELPDYEPYEDFVEGSLQVGDQALHIYYEHSLGYLSLSSESREVLQDVLSRLRPIMTVTSRGA